MKAIVADRRDFFRDDCYPITVKHISGDSTMQHEHDLTNIRHTHNFAELIIITNGYGTHWIDHEKYKVVAGDIFLIQGNTEHYFIERHDLSFSNIMFDDIYLKNHLKSLRSLPGYNALFLFEPNYRRYHRFQSHLHISSEALLPVNKMLHGMLTELNNGAPGYDLLLLAKTIEIFVQISREYAKCQNPMVRELNRLGEVISRLEKEYQRNWKITDIAKIAAMAPSTLLPVFKRATGHSPIDYLIHVRILKAAELLLKTNDSITTIAQETGFADSNYFSRQFRKIYNIAPKDYRNRLEH